MPFPPSSEPRWTRTYAVWPPLQPIRSTLRYTAPGTHVHIPTPHTPRLAFNLASVRNAFWRTMHKYYLISVPRNCCALAFGSRITASAPSCQRTAAYPQLVCKRGSSGCATQNRVHPDAALIGSFCVQPATSFGRRPKAEIRCSAHLFDPKGWSESPPNPIHDQPRTVLRCTPPRMPLCNVPRCIVLTALHSTCDW